MDKYRFYKEGTNWYVDLPEWEGSKSDLLMIGGADTMLDILSKNGTQVLTLISRTNFEGASELNYVKSAIEELGEGAFYNLEKHNGEVINLGSYILIDTRQIFIILKISYL